MNDTATSTRDRLNRRSVLKGAAWAAPAIAAAVAAPFAAASTCNGEYTVSVATSKDNGRFNWEHVVTVTHNGVEMTDLSGVVVTMDYTTPVPLASNVDVNSDTNCTAVLTKPQSPTHSTLTLTGTAAKSSPMTVSVNYGGRRTNSYTISGTVSLQVSGCSEIAATNTFETTVYS